MRVLLSEASSLTAREHLSVLGPTGVEVDAASSSRLPIARFSRWCRRAVPVPRSGSRPGTLDQTAAGPPDQAAGLAATRPAVPP